MSDVLPIGTWVWFERDGETGYGEIVEFSRMFGYLVAEVDGTHLVEPEWITRVSEQ